MDLRKRMDKMEGAEGAKYTEWILDTIDQLRRRKARPDLERICHMVERKHGPSFAAIAAELDKLVESQVVVKVDYKGSTSYRNAAKWRKSHFGNVQNSASSSAKLEAAVRSLLGCNGEDSPDDTATDPPVRNCVSEASMREIERWLQEQDPDTKLVAETLQVALDREVEAYNLGRTTAGNYIIGDPSKKPPPPEKDKSKNGQKSGNGKPKSKSKKKAGATGPALVVVTTTATTTEGAATTPTPTPTTTSSPTSAVTTTAATIEVATAAVAGGSEGKPVAQPSTPNKTTDTPKKATDTPKKATDTPKKATDTPKKAKLKSPEPKKQATVKEKPAEMAPKPSTKLSVTQAQIQEILSGMKKEVIVKEEPRSPSPEEDRNKELLNKASNSASLASKPTSKPPSKDPAEQRSKSPLKPHKEKTVALTPSKKNRPASAKRKRIRKSHGPDFEESFTPPKAKERRRMSMEQQQEQEHDDDEDDDNGGDEEQQQEQQVEDEEVADLDTSSVDGSDPRCDFCLQACNPKDGKDEPLLFCKDCPAKAHPSCMEYSEELARRARTSPWQCIECKTCYICTDSRDPDSMLFCDACDKGYHMDCHNPPIKAKPTGKWVCSRCMQELGLTEDDMEVEEATNASTDNYNSDGGGASCLPTPTDSPLHFATTTTTTTASNNKNNASTAKFSSSSSKVNGNIVAPVPKLATTMKADVPDASEWTIGDVVDFFMEMGFTQQAEVFREQEIDGRSLLLMKRSDVLQGLGLKLGPALKIYAHVQRLQTRGHIVY